MCDKAACRCDTGYPLASGITGTLGFYGPQQCCRAPCTAFPIHHVKICIRINEHTSVKIQQGCGIKASAKLLKETYGCPVDYNWGLIENSWGRSCRTVEWNRMVPSTSFIRLQLCPVDNCTSCADKAYTLCGNAIKNQLLKFEVDQVDYTAVLQSVATYYTSDGFYGPLGILGCIQVTCGNTYTESEFVKDKAPVWKTDYCCDNTINGSAYKGVDLADMRIGTTIQFGPLGQPISGLGFV